MLNFSIRKAISLVVLFSLVLQSCAPVSLSVAIPLANLADTNHQTVKVKDKASYQHPVYEHGEPRIVNRASESKNLQTQSSAISLICIDALCSDPGPNTTLTEIFDDDSGGIEWYAGGSIRFRLQCEGTGCVPKNIYYRAVLDGEFLSTPTFGTCGQSCFWGANLYADLHLNSNAIWGLQNGTCGTTLSGTCHFEISGVIPAEMISDNINDWNSDYFAVYASINNAASWEWLDVHAEIQVSFDPALLNSEIPAESANCKEGCNYGQSQGWAADPINTNTGALSYSETDLELQTGAGPLTFERTYVSSFIDTFTSPLGYGWMHNQDIQLIFPSGNELGFVNFKDQSGNLFRFWGTGTGTYVPYAGYTGRLVKNPGTPATYTLTDQKQNVYSFDQNGKLSTRTSPTGQAFAYTYDGSGRLSRVSADGGAHYLDFTYNPQGQLTTVTDHTNRSIFFTYDGSGDLVSYTDVRGQTWNYTYAAHRLVDVIDPDAIIKLHNVYYTSGPNAGLAWKQFDGEGNLIAELTYNTNGTTTITDALGNQSVDEYNAAGALVKQTTPLGRTTEKAYDANFRPNAIVDEMGNLTGLVWSPDGADLIQVRDPNKAVVDLTYDGLHNITSVIDARDYLTTFEYSGTLLTDLANALDETTAYTYTPQGYLESVTDPLLHTTQYTYNSMGLVETVTNELNHTTTYGYDVQGKLTSVIDPAGRVTRNTYDAAGNLSSTIQNYDAARPQNDLNVYNITTTFEYDARGNMTRMTDTLNRVTQYVYDDADRLVQTIDADLNVTTSSYDAAG